MHLVQLLPNLHESKSSWSDMRLPIKSIFLLNIFFSPFSIEKQFDVSFLFKAKFFFFYFLYIVNQLNFFIELLF